MWIDSALGDYQRCDFLAQRSLGRPTTATSQTAGWVAIASSTSRG